MRNIVVSWSELPEILPDGTRIAVLPVPPEELGAGEIVYVLYEGGSGVARFLRRDKVSKRVTLMFHEKRVLEMEVEFIFRITRATFQGQSIELRVSPWEAMMYKILRTTT